MLRAIVALLIAASGAGAAGQPGRVVESVLPFLAYGPSCWSTVELQNLGDRSVEVEVEGHRESGALVPLAGHPEMKVRMGAGERAGYRLQVAEETAGAWVKVRERVPRPELSPVIAVSGTTECVDGDRLRATVREIAYPMRNPWFSGEVAEMSGNLIAVINTSEGSATARLCYSSGALFSVPGTELQPVCSNAFEVRIPPFGARQFPVRREGNSGFLLETEGSGIVLQMLRPLPAGVRMYTVDSTIRFEEGPRPAGQ